MAGYGVYYSDSRIGEYSLLSRTLSKDSVYSTKVALNLLNKKLYYCLIAYDSHLNASKSSDTLVLLRPDTLRPVSGNILAYALSDTSIYLRWANSPSLDLRQTYLLRQSEGDSRAVLLCQYPSGMVEGSYLDSCVLEKVNYTYILLSEDDTGLYSDSLKIVLSTTYSGIRQALSDIVYELNREKRSVKLSWAIPTRKVIRYTLYRQGPQDSYLSSYRVIRGDYGSYVDVGLSVSCEYKYRLMALYEDGSRSALSPIISIELPSTDR